MKRTRTDAESHKGTKFPPEPLSPAEARALLQAAGQTRSRTISVRNQALVVTLWRAGLRVSEALALKPSDVDADTCTIRVLRGKGSKSRTVGMDPEAFAVLGRWLDRRRDLRIDARLPLFCTLTGDPLDDRYVRTALRRAADRAGIAKRVHPHGLRHTMAVELVREGVPLPEIQDQLGHASLDGTSHYIRSLYPNGAIDRMRKRTGWLDSDSHSNA